MSALEALLGPRPGDATAATPHAPRTLLLEKDVFIYLQEDPTLEEITFYSVPGVMQEVEWLSRRDDPWSNVQPHPAHEDAICALTVESGTRTVFLSETWPCAAVDLVVLANLLSEHARRHLLWREMLESVLQGQEEQR